MHMTMIQFKRADQQQLTDVCVVRNQGVAKQYAAMLQAKYPSYQSGEFVYKKVKFIQSVPKEC